MEGDGFWLRKPSQMKRTVAVMLIAIVVCGLIFVGYKIATPHAGDITKVWSSGPTVTHLESLGQLVATKVYVSDVLTAEGEGYCGSWLIKGDALISIDLSRATVVEVDSTIRRARIILPQPKVLSARVDHERSKTWDVKKTTWVPFGGNGDALRDRAMFEAQKLVGFAASSKENMDHARSSAEKVIEGIYRMVEWQVVIEWQPAIQP